MKPRTLWRRNSHSLSMVTSDMPSIKFGNLLRTKMECFFLSPASEVVEKLTSIKHSVMHYVRKASSSYVSHPLVLHVSFFQEAKQHIPPSKSLLITWMLTPFAAFQRKVFELTFSDRQMPLSSLMNA